MWDSHAMALQNLLVLEQSRSSQLCRSVMSLAQRWLHHYSWRCHDPLGHLCTPALNWLSDMVTVIRGWWSQMQASPRACSEAWTVSRFLLAFCGVNVEQCIFHLCLLLSFLRCNHCIPRMGPFSMLTTPYIPHTDTRRVDRQGAHWQSMKMKSGPIHVRNVCPSSGRA